MEHLSPSRPSPANTIPVDFLGSIIVQGGNTAPISKTESISKGCISFPNSSYKNMVMEDRSRRKPVNWKAALVSASFVMAYASQEVTGFQPQSSVLLRVSTNPVYSSNIRMDAARSPPLVSESRTWNEVQRQKGTTRSKGAVGPILTDNSPIHVTAAPASSQGEKR